MKNLDLEKIIILLCLLGLPITGGWIYNMKSELEEADRAFQNCDAMILKIHGLHELIDRTKKATKEVGDLARPDTYFENRAILSQSGGKEGGELFLKREHIRISYPPRRKVRRDGSGPVIGEDIPVKIEFLDDKARRGRLLSRSFINAFIVNCESPAPIWRLRNLKMTNKSFKGLRPTKAPPDLVLPDEWIVDEMLFARRSPLKVAAKRE